MTRQQPRTVWRIFATLLGLICCGGILAEMNWQAMATKLVDEVKRETYLARDYLGKSELDPRVLAAMESVPRHEFVPEMARARAYGNHPLPIGDGQTISQPFIVALMTDLLQVKPGDRVLEVGTGSGYQAAVLAELVDEVYSVEIVGNLARAASTTLALLGYDNVQVRHGDGLLGWPEAAPFDGIMVTAAGLDIPDTLIEQLKPGARLVMPVGAQHEVQQLKVVTREYTGGLTETDKLPVRFVPITRNVR
ncbi:MAG: protein-L-isoaspartate(D-aspartate) O-methyltransferase [Proteobacteria bacterium]|jgi:protein-L-isoaspartate(D-aspartate) O-methyltransferase|nr:protein-L-isoaspartate(D-aspartate) O-methyltransferase [Pseudomonadota bacterium]